MSRVNVTSYSSTGSQPYPPYDDDDQTSYLHAEYEPNDQGSLYSTSASSESDISPNDSASIPAARSSSHARYQSHPRSHPRSHPHPHTPYPPSHEPPHVREERPLRKLHHRRPPEHNPRSEPSRHGPYPEHVPSPSDPSELSGSLASHYGPGYSARGSYHEPPYDEQYQDQYWPQQSAHYTGPPTMMSNPSASHYSTGAALTPYDHYAYAGQTYPYAGQPSPGNPFTPSPPPLAPSPQPGYYYDPYGTHQMHRPDMLTRTSMPYLPPEMQYPAHTQRPYSMHHDMMHAMMPRAFPHHLYQSHPPTPGPEENPPRPEKKENPPSAPAAPPAPPPPTAEEIRKQKEEDAAIQTANLVNALKALQVEEKALAAAADKENQKVQAESDKIAALLAGFEKDRLAREEAAAAKAATEKAAAEAKAAFEKELADAATTARVNAEKEAAAAAALAKAENEKAIAEAKAEHEKLKAEAKAAADAAEAAKKAAEEELKKNAPEPDSGKPPIKFMDAVDRNFTLPWHLAKTWKGMEALIKQAFVNIERIGPHVANGHYHLLGPNNEIILPQVWEVVVQPGWEIKMQLWPLPEPIEEKAAPIGFPPEMAPVVPQRKHSSRGNKVSGKSAGKRASVGPAPMPPPPPSPIQPVQYASSPPPPPLHMPTAFAGYDDLDDPIVEVFVDNGGGRSGGGGGHKPKSSANSRTKKQVPAFTKWMLGGTRPRPKGHEKLAAVAR